MSDLATPQAHDWERFWDRSESRRFQKVSWSKKRILNVLAPYAGAGRSALDAGCGSGFFSRYFCERGMRTVSVDHSESALKMTESLTQGRAKVIKADLVSENSLREYSGQFDLIFSDGLLEHFSRAHQDIIMGNLLSVLSGVGVIVTFVPNRWSPWEIIRPLFMPGIDERPFVLNELINLNVRNESKVIRSGGVNTLPFAVSPEGKCARYFGMLLFTIAQKE